MKLPLSSTANLAPRPLHETVVKKYVRRDDPSRRPVKTARAYRALPYNSFFQGFIQHFITRGCNQNQGVLHNTRDLLTYFTT